eukprot:366474-Chlamydomonas_euryale.AAC.21
MYLACTTSLALNIALWTLEFQDHVDVTRVTADCGTDRLEGLATRIEPHNLLSALHPYFCGPASQTRNTTIYGLEYIQQQHALWAACSAGICIIRRSVPVAHSESGVAVGCCCARTPSNQSKQYRRHRPQSTHISCHIH